MRAMTFDDDVTSILIDKFKDHYVVKLDFTSILDATNICQYPELLGEPLRLGLNFTYLLGHVTEMDLSRERKSSVSFDKIWVVGREI